jgi:hypothetical protein
MDLETKINKLRLLYIVDQLAVHPFRYAEDPIFDETIKHVKHSLLGNYEDGKGCCITKDTIQQLRDISNSYGMKCRTEDFPRMQFMYTTLVVEIVEVYFNLTDELITSLELGYSLSI